MPAEIAADPPQPVLDYAGPIADERYHVGTLHYTKFGLFIVFTWMLWGDFCFTMMERVIPKILPLQMKSMGASNASINLLVGSIPAVMNMIITPIVSVKSDRYRSPRGRRIPFLLWPTPFVTLFLILIGYTPQLEGVLHRLSPNLISPNKLALLMLGAFMVLFQFFNMFVASVYYYLFNDVVPSAFLGRFVALFGIVASGAEFCFNLLVFPYAETHGSQIYLTLGILYFLAFFFMCRYVKEGEYPPPPAETAREGLIDTLRSYFRECFGKPFYLLIFGRMAFWQMGMTAGTFVTFFGKDLGLDLTQIGRINAANLLVMTIVLYPMGALVDRLHPVRMHLLALLLIPAISLCFFFFARSYWSFMLLSVLIAPAMALMSASMFPLINSVFPKDRFGQFCSAQALLVAVAIMAGSYLAGEFMDLVKDYRFLYVWMSVFQACAAACMLGACVIWRHNAGKSTDQS